MRVRRDLVTYIMMQASSERVLPTTSSCAGSDSGDLAGPCPSQYGANPHFLGEIGHPSAPPRSAGTSAPPCVYALTQLDNDTHLARIGRPPPDGPGTRHALRTAPLEGRKTPSGSGEGGTAGELGACVGQWCGTGVGRCSERGGLARFRCIFGQISELLCARGTRHADS